MIRRLNARLFFAAALLGAVTLQAKEDPVQWTLSAKTANAAPGQKAWLELQATIEPGWHLYSPTTPPGGPIITRIRSRIAEGDTPDVPPAQYDLPMPGQRIVGLSRGKRR